MLRASRRAAEVDSATQPRARLATAKAFDGSAGDDGAARGDSPNRATPAQEDDEADRGHHLNATSIMRIKQHFQSGDEAQLAADGRLSGSQQKQESADKKAVERLLTLSPKSVEISCPRRGFEKAGILILDASNRVRGSQP